MSALLLIEPEPEQVEQLEKGLPGWKCMVGGERDVDHVEELANEVDSLDAILVYAQTHEEDRALRLCEHLRQRPDASRIPLLVVITIYQMMLGNSVKKGLPNSDFVFRPIDTENLRGRIDQLSTNDTQ